MNRSKTQSGNPSFSSTLLDEIYNSIDDAKTLKSQPFVTSVNTSKKQSIVTKSIPESKIHKDRSFVSSVSSSSDSNSSIFSSSDTELTHTKKKTSSSSRPLCFGPSKTKPRKTEDNALFHQPRNIRVHDVYDENWENPRARRTEKSYVSHKQQPKTPASPAGRLVHFINSLFNNNSKHSMAVKSFPRKTSYEYDDSVFVKKPTCSSASSFSRSCLNKRFEESSHERIKRNVRFEAKEEEEECFSKNYIGKLVKKSVEDGGRRSVEEIAKEFLRDYRKKHEMKNNGFEDFDEEDEDDVASDSSSDLFELDLVGSHHHNVYGDELPVYETTFATLVL